VWKKRREKERQKEYVCGRKGETKRVNEWKKGEKEREREREWN